MRNGDPTNVVAVMVNVFVNLLGVKVRAGGLQTTFALVVLMLKVRAISGAATSK